MFLALGLGLPGETKNPARKLLNVMTACQVTNKRYGHFSVVLLLKHQRFKSSPIHDYKRNTCSCTCEKGIINLLIVLVSLGWDTHLLANLFRLSLLPYCTVIKGGQKNPKNIQQPTCASDAKNTRQFLWDDNSKGLQRVGDNSPLRKTVKLHIQLISMFIMNAARYSEIQHD